MWPLNRSSLEPGSPGSKSKKKLKSTFSGLLTIRPTFLTNLPTKQGLNLLSKTKYLPVPVFPPPQNQTKKKKPNNLQGCSSLNLAKFSFSNHKLNYFSQHADFLEGGYLHTHLLAQWIIISPDEEKVIINWYQLPYEFGDYGFNCCQQRAIEYPQ